MAFKEFLQELYAPMGGVSVRSMFGGLGVFKDGVMFGLAAEDVYYLRVDDRTLGSFTAEASGPFVYTGMKDRTISLPYYRLPERLYDDADAFLAWSEAAFDVAFRAAAEKARGKKPVRKKAVSATAPEPTARKKPSPSSKRLAAKKPGSAKKPTTRKR